MMNIHFYNIMNFIEANSIKSVSNIIVSESEKKVFSWLHNEFNQHVDTRPHFQQESKFFIAYFIMFHNEICNNINFKNTILIVFILKLEEDSPSKDIYETVSLHEVSHELQSKQEIDFIGIQNDLNICFESPDILNVNGRYKVLKIINYL